MNETLAVIRERRRIVAAVIVLGIAAAIVLFILRPPRFTANVSLFVAAQPGANAQQAYQGAQLSAQKVRSYVDLVTDERILGETISQLGLTESKEDLRSQVQAAAEADSLVIRVSVTDTSPELAASIANAIGKNSANLVGELERPAPPATSPAVALRLVQQAPVPDEPSSIGLFPLILLGAIAGTLIGAGVATAIESFDDKVRGADELAEVAGSPSLGSLARDSSISSGGNAVDSDGKDSLGEQLRKIRTNLQYVDVDRPRRVIAISSSIPGEGKSTTVAILAAALASTGSSVIVVEADLRRPRMNEFFGVERDVGLTQVLAGRVALNDATQCWPKDRALHVLACGPLPPNPSELLGSEQMKRLIGQLRETYEYVLVDTPPLLPVTDAAAMAPTVDGVIVVCKYGTNRRQVSEAVSNLRAVSVEPLGTVLTMVPESLGGYKPYYYEAAESGRRAATPTGDSTITRPQRRPRSEPLAQHSSQMKSRR